MAMPFLSLAQDAATHVQPAEHVVDYKLIDIGTLGGPNRHRWIRRAAEQNAELWRNRCR